MSEHTARRIVARLTVPEHLPNDHAEPPTRSSPVSCGLILTEDPSTEGKGTVVLYSLADKAPQIDPTAYIHPDAVLIGDVRVGPHASVWPGAVLRGDRGFISIGARTSVQDGSVLHCTADLPTVIGQNCVIGHAVHIEGAQVDDGALIGSGSVVLQRAVVGAGAIVGAAALIAPGMVVPPRATALGVPARIRPDSADPALIAHAVRTYVENAAWYAAELRRIDT